MELSKKEYYRKKQEEDDYNRMQKEEYYRKVQKEVEAEGWKIKIFTSGNGAMGTRGRLAITATSLFNLLDRLKD